ncbi:hypothetical protein AZZ82_000545, partial [Klebsiella aerogenes]
AARGVEGGHGGGVSQVNCPSSFSMKNYSTSWK